MLKEKMLVPQLRFSEFEGDWKINKLGQIAKFLKGKGISKNDIINDGENECIRYGELYTTYNEVIDSIASKTNVALDVSVLSNENDVIIPSSGETQLDIVTASCVLKKGVILGGDLNIIRTNLNGVFLSYLLNNRKKKDIAKLSQGNSVVHLYNKQLATLNLNLPTPKEQQKIANFLTSIDNRIQTLEKKKTLLEQYKKGVMQKIFKQELRFKDDTSTTLKASDGKEFPEWEEKKFSKFIKLYRGSSPRPINRYLTKEKSGVNWIKIGDTKASRNYLLESVSEKITVAGSLKSRKVRKGELILANSMSFGKTYILNIDGCIYDGWFVLREFGDYFEKRFLIQQLNSEHMQRQYKRLSTGGVVQNISSAIVYSTKLRRPSLKEQTKIANFLSAIDRNIELVTKKIEHTKTYKKGLLQQIFL